MVQSQIALLEKLKGFRIGRLIGLDKYKFIDSSDALRKRKYLFFEFRCDCGVIRMFPVKSVLDGHTKSCGCYNRDRITTHSLSKTRLYKIWMGIKVRCNNPNFKHYNRYGGRGISIDKEWDNSFDKFNDWALSNGYNRILTIDRINNDGNYTSENCRWIDMKQQGQNRNNNIKYEYKGEMLTISVISQKININRASVNIKLRKGMSIEQIIKTHTKYNK